MSVSTIDYAIELNWENIRFYCSVLAVIGSGKHFLGSRVDWFAGLH